MMVFLLVASQHATYGIDSGIPRGEEAATDVDKTIYEIAPDFLRWSIGDFSLLDDEEYDPDSGLRYMGTFGPGFNGADWNDAYQWLSEQDSDEPFSQRPAFVSGGITDSRLYHKDSIQQLQTTSSQEFPIAEECFSHKDKKTHLPCLSQLWHKVT